MNSIFFIYVLKIVLMFEGGYVEIASDPGGKTNKGVTQQTYDKYRKDKKLSNKSVKDISDIEIRDIYYNRYFIASWCNVISEPIALVHFDASVNFGVTKSMILLKRALNIKEKKIDKDLINKKTHCKDSIEIALKYIDERIKERNDIVKRKPILKKFLKGWLKRDEKMKTIINEKYKKTI